jgi:hypothetical protein
MGSMSEMLSGGRGKTGGVPIRSRSFRRRRRLDLRTVATGAALFVAAAWTIIFGVGVVLR